MFRQCSARPRPEEYIGGEKWQKEDAMPVVKKKMCMEGKYAPKGTLYAKVVI